MRVSASRSATLALRVAVAALVAVPTGAFAQVSAPLPTIATLAQGEGPHRLALPVAASDDEVAAQSARLIRGGLAQFLQSDGRGWRVVFDRRSGLPMLFDGPGLALSGASAQAQVRGLLARFPGLLGTDEAATIDTADGSDELTFVRGRKAGSNAHDARLTFVFNHGRLVQIHAEKWLPGHQGAAQLTADAALARLRDQVQAPAALLDLTTELADVALAATAEPPGVYTGLFGAGYEIHLAYIFRFRLPGDTRTFVGYVDAETGTLLDFFDDNRYEGFVTGGVYPRTIAASETTLPFALARVANGATTTTDLGGGYTYAGGTASTALAGSFFKVSDPCGTPNGTTSSAPGDISLGTSTGTDCILSALGHSTRAARNAFFHLNNARQMGIKWLGGVNATATTWFSTDVTANVNINQTCNAYWDGSSVNFFKSGSGCANTGEIADVMQHEWGHGLDQNTKSGSIGDAAKGEAVADGIALLLTHDQCIGPGFFPSGSGGETATCPTAVRDLAFVVTASNIGFVCPISFTCTGALGYECHCESHILSGAYWNLQQLFAQRYGTSEGWNRFERDYLRALPNTTAYKTGTAGNAYDAWMAADDDNGNITDGTPNADIIYQAFSAQGIAGTSRPVNNVACPVPPAAPVVGALGNADSIALTWNAVAGASSYAVYRRLDVASASPAYLPLASGLSTTDYTDTQVAPNYQYWYQVVAQVGACSSAYGAGVAATATSVNNDFTLSLNPASVTLAAGTSTTVLVHTAVASGAAESIAVSVSGLPAGVSGSFSPASVTAGADSTLTLSAAANAAAASATFTVTGTAASATHAAQGTVTVTNPTPTNDFSIGLSPASATVADGASTTVTVITSVTSGAAETIALSISGLPAGVTGSFSPASITAGGSATLTLTASANAAPVNSVSFTVTGTAASATHSTTGTLTVTAPTPSNDFSIAVTPASLTLPRTQAADVTVSTAVVSGSAESIALSVSGLPSGVTASFNPATVTAGGAATLTLTANSKAATGTFSITIGGTAASASHSATLTLTVSGRGRKR